MCAVLPEVRSEIDSGGFACECFEAIGSHSVMENEISGKSRTGVEPGTGSTDEHTGESLVQVELTRKGLALLVRAASIGRVVEGEFSLEESEALKLIASRLDKQARSPDGSDA